MKTMPLTGSKRTCIKKFLHYFPKGFRDQKYISWERNYKWEAHEKWCEELEHDKFKKLLSGNKYKFIVDHIIRLESRTNLLFSFEKMALRDAVRTSEGAKPFAHGLYEYIHGTAPMKERFEQFTTILENLPRKQTRVLTWPLHTVFGFIADPEKHIFLKPKVTRTAAAKYGFPFIYESRPNWNTYQSTLDLANDIRTETASLKPKDMIDLQSFIWVMGSEEYPD